MSQLLSEYINPRSSIFHHGLKIKQQISKDQSYPFLVTHSFIPTGALLPLSSKVMVEGKFFGFEYML